MRLRLVTAAAVAGMTIAALPSHAATAKPQITDAAGDANGVNGQGVVIGLPDAATPADASSADITSVQFQSTFKKKKRDGKLVKVPTGFTVKMTLSAPPTTPEVFYRVIGATSNCDSVFFEYGTDVATGDSNVRCPSTPPKEDVDYSDADAVVKGNTITWTLPLTAFPVGTTFSSLAAHTRFNPAVVTAPQIDEAASSASFTVGK